MPTGTIESVVSVGGMSFTSKVVRIATGQESHQITLPAGVAGVLAAGSPPTSVTGLATPFVIGDLVDIHWTDPGDGTTHKCRRGIRVDAITPSTIITFDETPAGLGDAFPTSGGVAVVVSKQIIIDSDWDFDLAEMFAAKSTVRAMADFWATTPASALALKLVADAAYEWANGTGITLPFTGNPIDKILVTNGTATAGTFQVGVLFRSS